MHRFTLSHPSRAGALVALGRRWPGGVATGTSPGVARPEVPYRSSAGKAPPSKPEPDDGGLDQVAFDQRRLKKAKVEAEAAKYRAENATRQVRYRAGLAFVLALGAAALAAPAVMDGGGHVPRRLGRVVVLAPALLFYSLFTLYAGTGGADSLDEAPQWVRYGGIVAALVGAALGFGILFSVM